MREYFSHKHPNGFVLRSVVIRGGRQQPLTQCPLDTTELRAKLVTGYVQLNHRRA
jgi:hypothetical protein